MARCFERLQCQRKSNHQWLDKVGDCWENWWRSLEVSISYIRNCESCNGLGYVAPRDPSNRYCVKCNGAGRFIKRPHQPESVLHDTTKERDFSWTGEGRGISFGKDDSIKDLFCTMDEEFGDDWQPLKKLLLLLCYQITNSMAVIFLWFQVA